MCFNHPSMGAIDGREGKIRAGMTKGQLGGKLAGLSLPRQIISIALWPLLEQVMSFIGATTSLYLATHMDTPDEVTKQIAAGIGVTAYIMWLGFLMQGAVGMGATAIVSRMTGARRFREANYAANQSMALGMLAGLLSALLMYASSDFLITKVLKLSDYASEVAILYMNTSCWVAIVSGIVFAANAALRGAGDTRTPFYIMVLVDGLTIVFSILFVYGFGWGITGLALGVIGGMAVAAVVLLSILIHRLKVTRRLMQDQQCRTLDEFCARQSSTYVHPLYLDPASLKPDFREMYRIIVIGFPQAMEVGGIWLIQMYVLRIISSLGDTAVGAHTIAIRIESMSFLPGFAIGMAGATLIGQYLGTGSARMALETVRRCCRYAMLFMGSMGVVFCLFPSFFVEILASNSRELVDATIPLLHLFLILEPFYAGMLIIKMCLRGAGDTRRMMIVSYTCMGFFRFVLLFIWNVFWPETLTLPRIWSLFIIDLIVQYIILRKMLFDLKWARVRV